MWSCCIFLHELTTSETIFLMNYCLCPLTRSSVPCRPGSWLRSSPYSQQWGCRGQDTHHSQHQLLIYKGSVTPTSMPGLPHLYHGDQIPVCRVVRLIRKGAQCQRGALPLSPHNPACPLSGHVSRRSQVSCVPGRRSPRPSTFSATLHMTGAQVTITE